MTFVPTLGRALTKGERYDGDTETFIASTLTGTGAAGTVAIANGASVRRLTPTECERLQALPDQWTNPAGDAPDSRRYSGLGDAVTASVGEWIGRRILADDGAA